MMMPTGTRSSMPGIIHGKKTSDADVQVVHGLPADLSRRVHQGVHVAGADAPDHHPGLSHSGQRFDFRADDLGARNLPPGSATSRFGRRGHLAASAGAASDNE